MRVGIVCYASVGGSGIIATELGKTLAARGHDVHILSSDTPFRLSDYQPGLTFHRVDTPSYPLFREPQYLLSLANKIVQVARNQQLDVIHAHYAVPHATAAYLARQILLATPARVRGGGRVRPRPSRGARPLADGRRRPGPRQRDADGYRARHRGLRALPGRAGPGAPAPVHLGRVSAAVRAGKLRPRRARGDGV